MMHIEAGRIVTSEFCRHFKGLNRILSMSELKFTAFFIVTESFNHYANAIICGVFIIYGLTGNRFKDRLMFINP